MVCWLPGVGALVETEWFYEIITLMMVITGNVQLTSAENEDQSELVLFSKIQNPAVAMAVHRLLVVN